MYDLNKKDLEDYLILRSSKVKWQKYKAVNSLDEDVEPAYHCLKNAKYRDVKIPGYFSSAEYMALNPEVIELDLHPLVHFIQCKKQGHRPKRKSLFSKGKLFKVAVPKTEIENKGVSSLTQLELEDFVYLYNADIPWKELNNDSEDMLELVLYACTQWKNKPLIIDGYFNSAVYLSMHEDVRKSGSNPLVHFVKYGAKEKRQALKDAVTSIFDTPGSKQNEIKQLASSKIDWAEFFAFNNIKPGSKKDPVEYYVENWRNENLRIDNFFDTAFYLGNYPDIAAANINPLAHFLNNGEREGRVGCLRLSDHIDDGDIPFDSSKKTLAIVSHESSATGAPLVGLNLGNVYTDELNVIHVVLKEQKIHEDFVNNSSVVVSHLKDNPRFFIAAVIKELVSRFPIDGAICNSVETIEVLDVFSELKIPTVSLIHEFSDYTLPKGKLSYSVCFADRMVVPATIIKNSITREIKECFGIEDIPNNISVFPQGNLPFAPTAFGSNLSPVELAQKFKLENDQFLVVGAGYVQIRKGVDLFISVANYLNKMQPGKFRFVWAGEGFEPDIDLSYSVWLKKQIIESGLESSFTFLGHQRSLDNLLDITDVFLMTSRLDPFPNVVIDALSAGVHVGCFENSTGCAELLLNNKCSASVAKYADAHELARMVGHFITQSAEYRIDNQNLNIELVKSKLNFTDYAARIIDELNKAKEIVQKRKKYESDIFPTNMFDAKFYGIQTCPDAALDHYVKCAIKNLRICNPSPSFNEAIWHHKFSKKEMIPGLAEGLLEQQTSTHKNKIIEGSNTKHNLRGAVHLHLFYPDMLSFFVEKLQLVPKNFDIYVTVCENDAINIVEDALSEAGFATFQVKRVKNKGRDVVPFFSELKEELLIDNEYDVVGHFHTKKSLDNDDGIGDKWLTYLLDNLLYDSDSVNEILTLFMDSSCGLVFASDRHIVGFGENKTFSNKLCDAMQIERLENAACFPLGTMFWARPKALSSLFNLDFTPFIQDEPLPYDGSYMHAVERLIPHVALNNGYEPITVYKKDTNW